MANIKSKAFKVNIKVLSFNQCWQGKIKKSVAYHIYRKELLKMLPNMPLPEPPYRLHLQYGFSSRAGDIDNPNKALIDVLTEFYGFDDKLIYELFIRKRIVPRGQEYFMFRFEHIKV